MLGRKLPVRLVELVDIIGVDMIQWRLSSQLVSGGKTGAVECCALVDALWLSVVRSAA